MALFGRDDRDARTERPQPTPQASMPAPSASPREAAPGADRARSESSTGAGDVQAHLGKGSRVSGKLTFDGAVRVDGGVEGEISAQDMLIVGESAVVTAQITGATVIIMGKVTGDINARKRVEIRAPGKLFGNITTPSLVIHEGVVFEGHCSMGSSEGRSDRKVTPFPKEEKGGDGSLGRASTEATK